MILEDQTGQKIAFLKAPQRVISLVPSQSEFLSDAGLGDRLLGVTKFCVHPKSLRAEKTLIGGTKKVDIKKVRNLFPDLVIANKEENTLGDILEIRKFCPVWTSDIKNEIDAFEMMDNLSEILGLNFDISQIKEKFATLKNSGKIPGRVLYLIWRNPYMSIGGNTFISRMLNLTGFDNVCENLSRYPVLDTESLEQLRPSHVFLSSEPFPFKRSHLQELMNVFPEAQIKLVDGEMFSWYGTRMVKSLEYFIQEF
ncbi:MAG: helical backbone metal receptor [Flavobacteriales bacterium]